MSQQLMGTEHLNAGLAFINGSPCLELNSIKKDMEGRQLFFKSLDCTAGGEAHYRLMTPHALSEKEQLKCPICHPRARVKNTLEIKVLEALRADGVAGELIWQWAPPFWDGRVDWYHYPSATIIQVDGSPHFEGIRRLHACQLLRHDLEFCTRAWESGGAGLGVVRVHEADLPSALLINAAILEQGKFICLSPAYKYVRWEEGGGNLSYVEWLHRKLGASCTCCTRPDFSIWFSPA
jgi:hypothetical protein